MLPASTNLITSYLFLDVKLVGAGLVKFVVAGNFPTEKGYDNWNDWAQETEKQNQFASRDFLKKAYLAKRGEGSLQSRDGTITIKPMGLYEGVDISIRELLMERISYHGLRIIEEEKEDGLYFNLSVNEEAGGGGLPPEKIIDLIIERVDTEIKALQGKLREEVGTWWDKFKTEMKGE